jgi:hypothetical protein
MPGTKDYISVNSEGKKRMILCNLKEHNPQKFLGLSKFAESWPKNCALAAMSGMQPICMCTIHQNV